MGKKHRNRKKNAPNTAAAAAVEFKSEIDIRLDALDAKLADKKAENELLSLKRPAPPPPKYSAKKPPTRWHAWRRGQSMIYVEKYFLTQIKTYILNCEVCKDKITDHKDLRIEGEMQSHRGARWFAVHHACSNKK